MEGADPEFFGYFAIYENATDAAPREAGCSRLAVPTVRQLLGQKQLKPLLHLPSGLVGEGNGQNLRRIYTVLPNQVGNAMGQGRVLPLPAPATTNKGPSW